MDANGGQVDLQGLGGPSRLHYDRCDDVRTASQDGASRPDDHPLFAMKVTSPAAAASPVQRSDTLVVGLTARSLTQLRVLAILRDRRVKMSALAVLPRDVGQPRDRGHVADR
jgi:hypothetical protein